MYCNKFQLIVLKEDLKVPIEELVERCHARRVAYILHDKDRAVAPHYHVYLEFKRRFSSKEVASIFGIPEYSISKVYESYNSIVCYFRQILFPSRYHYSANDIVTNF